MTVSFSTGDTFHHGTRSLFVVIVGLDDDLWCWCSRCLIEMFLHFIIVRMLHDCVRVFEMCCWSLPYCCVTKLLSFLTPMNLVLIDHVLFICWLHEDDEDPNLLIYHMREQMDLVFVVHLLITWRGWRSESVDVACDGMRLVAIWWIVLLCFKKTCRVKQKF